MILAAFERCLGGSLGNLLGGNIMEFYRLFCEEYRLAGDNFRGDGWGMIAMSFA